MALDDERENNQRMQRDEAAVQAHVVSTIGQALEKIARGDLTVRCADLGQNYAALRDNFNDALAHLEAAMSQGERPRAAISASARKKSVAPPTICRSAPSARRQAWRKPRPPSTS